MRQKKKKKWVACPFSDMGVKAMLGLARVMYFNLLLILGLSFQT